MRIAEFLSPRAVIADLQSRSKQDAMRELSKVLATAHAGLDEGKLLAVLEEREKLGSTGLQDGVAIPHGKMPGLSQLIAAFGVSKEGIEFDSLDGRPTQLFFALVAPENSAGIHLKALARISRLFKNPRFRASILEAGNPDEIYRAITEEDARA